jgi:ABC-2 type transport system permease protein
VIKQSAAVMIAVLLGMISVAVPLILMFTVHALDARAVTYATLLLLAVSDVWLYRYIMTKGIQIFSTF